MPLNVVQTLKAFFDDRPLIMDELKALPKDARRELCELAKAEMIRRGTHTESDFALGD